MKTFCTVLLLLNIVCIGIDVGELVTGHVGFIFNLLLNSAAAFWVWLILEEKQ